MPRVGTLFIGRDIVAEDRMILPFQGTSPRIHESAFIAPNAMVIGDVEVGEGASVWFGAVVRGDVFHVHIGRGTNIQDNTVIHVSAGQHATIIGEDVTVGHSVVLHGCTVRDRALVGIGSIVLDQAEIGEEAMIGAGSLVTPGTVIPPRMLALGSPCRVKRPLTDDELEHLRVSGPHYTQLAALYR
jgi:gamma-carbonic anhydrase